MSSLFRRRGEPKSPQATKSCEVEYLPSALVDHWRPLERALAPRVRLLGEEQYHASQHGWARFRAEEEGDPRLVFAGEYHIDERTLHYQKEMERFSKLEHSGLVPLLHHGRQEDWFWRVFPAAPGVPILKRDGHHHPRLIQSWLAQWVAALDYLHGHQVFFSDMVPWRVRVEGERLWLMDPVSPDLRSCSSDWPPDACYTPFDLSAGPAAANFFSLGAILFELLTGQFAFRQFLVFRPGEEGPSRDVDEVPEEFRQTIADLLDRNPEVRKQRFLKLRESLVGPAKPVTKGISWENLPEPYQNFEFHFAWRAQPWEWLAFVDGRCYPLPEKSFFPDRLFLQGPLSLDAGGENLLQDERLQSLLAGIQQILEQRLQDFLNPPRLNDPEAEQAYAYFLRHSQPESVERFWTVYLEQVEVEKTGEGLNNFFWMNCWQFWCSSSSPPDRFRELVTRHPFFLEKCDLGNRGGEEWTRLVSLSHIVFPEQEQDRLFWLLTVWLVWKPDFLRWRPSPKEARKFWEALQPFQLPERLDPSLVNSIAGYPKWELKYSGTELRDWLKLLPATWSQSRHQITESLKLAD